MKGPPGKPGGFAPDPEVAVETNIVGIGLGIPERFHDYVEEKSEKITHITDRMIAFEVKVSRHHDKSGKNGDDRVELTLIGPGPLVRAEASAGDKYSAFDKAIDKLTEQVRRAKERKQARRGRKRQSLHTASTSEFAAVDIRPAPAELIDRVRAGESPVDDEEHAEEYCPVVIREKTFPAEWMTADEAVDRMELVGHDFFLFIDARTDRPSVVYRRKGWDYGVIGLSEEAEAQKA